MWHHILSLLIKQQSLKIEVSDSELQIFILQDCYLASPLIKLTFSLKSCEHENINFHTTLPTPSPTLK